ncbi:MAG: hypothetical protein RR744_00410 [Cellulosilyticaceae bacterium]
MKFYEDGTMFHRVEANSTDMMLIQIGDLLIDYDDDGCIGQVTEVNEDTFSVEIVDVGHSSYEIGELDFWYMGYSGYCVIDKDLSGGIQFEF